MKFLTLKQLAELTCARLVGDEDHKIYHVNSLKEASENEASFMANTRYLEEMKATKAGVICIDSDDYIHPGKNFLISSDASVTFQKIAEQFILEKRHTGFQKIHPTSVIHPTAKIGKNVQLGPYAVVDENAVIGDDTEICAHVYIGARAVIGKKCLLYPSAIVREDSQIGNRVILQPGCVIGSCGFGYFFDKTKGFQKIPQLGIVVIEDDVEIGANTTIDRARFKETRICRGSKIDNLVQIAHNVEIGEDNAIAAQSGIAGSSKTEKGVILGGQVGVVGHVTIKEGTQVAAKSGISKSYTPYAKLRGYPATTYDEFQKQMIFLRNFSKFIDRIEALEKNLAALVKEK